MWKLPRHQAHETEGKSAGEPFLGYRGDQWRRVWFHERKVNEGCHLQEKFRKSQVDLHSVCIDLEKAYLTGCQERSFIGVWNTRGWKSTSKWSKCAVGATQAFPIEVGCTEVQVGVHSYLPSLRTRWQSTAAKKFPGRWYLRMMWCCGVREKWELEEDLEQWENAQKKRGMKVSRSKTWYMCQNGSSTGSVENWRCCRHSYQRQRHSSTWEVHCGQMEESVLK